MSSTPLKNTNHNLVACAKTGDGGGVGAALRSGAGHHIPGEDGRFALHHAAAGGHSSVVRQLLDAGADIEVASSLPRDDGGVALHLAAEGGHVAVLRLLLSSGAHPNARDNKGRTAVHWAALRSQVSSLMTLHDLGCDLHILEVGHANALHFAVASGSLEAVRWLVEVAKVNKEQCDLNSRTPADLAKKKGHKDLLAYLKSNQWSTPPSPVLHNSVQLQKDKRQHGQHTVEIHRESQQRQQQEKEARVLRQHAALAQQQSQPIPPSQHRKSQGQPVLRRQNSLQSLQGQQGQYSQHSQRRSHSVHSQHDEEPRGYSTLHRQPSQHSLQSQQSQPSVYSQQSLPSVSSQPSTYSFQNLPNMYSQQSQHKPHIQQSQRYPGSAHTLALLTHQNRDIQHRLDQQEGREAELQRKSAEDQQLIAALRREVERLTQSLISKEAQQRHIDALVNREELSSRTVRELTRRLTHAEDANRAMLQESRNKERVEAGLREEVNQLRIALGSLRPHHTAQVEAENRERVVVALREEVNQLRQALDTLHQPHHTAQLEERVRQLTEQDTMHRRAIVTLRQELQSVRTTQTPLQDHHLREQEQRRLRVLTSEVETSRETITSLTARLTEAENRVKEQDKLVYSYKFQLGERSREAGQGEEANRAIVATLREENADLKARLEAMKKRAASSLTRTTSRPNLEE